MHNQTFLVWNLVIEAKLTVQVKRKWKSSSSFNSYQEQLSSHGIRSQVVLPFQFGLIFCYIFKLNHTPSYEKKNDRKCSRVPMNTGSNLRIFFFSSECHQRPMYGQSGKIAYFGTRVPNFSRIYLYISRFANSEILKWEKLKIPIKSLPSPLKICHTFCRTCAKYSAFVCQDISTTCLLIAVYKILQNLIGKFHIFCIGK